MQPLITFDRVSKRYRRYASTGLRETLSRTAHRWFTRTASLSMEEQWLWAVRDLSFQLLPGRTMGIIGPNGAGKTTTLKLLSRITRPTSGQIGVRGRVSALIELGAGFHPELTGRENVFLNGTILGMRRREVAERLDDIIQFAQLERFIDTPVKYYSSGMYARLGFAVAAHTDPDVLLVDEVLAVGDYSYQQRCHARMRRLRDQGATILLVSHNMTAISENCDEVVILDRGRLAFHGPTPQALVWYADLVRATPVSKASVKVGQDGIGQRVITHGAKILEAHLKDRKGLPAETVAPGEWVVLEATIDFREDAVHPHFSCFVRDQRGQLIYDQTTLWQHTITPSFPNGAQVTVGCELQMNLIDGIYQIGIDLHYQDLTCYYDRLESAVSIVVAGGDGARGIADLHCRFCFPEHTERGRLAARSVE